MIKIAAALTAALVSAVIGGLFVMWCWNYFPFLEGLHHMSWWDAMVMYILSNVLFKPNSSK